MLTLNQAILLDTAFERLTKALRDEVRIRNTNNKLLDENYRIMHPIIDKWMSHTNAQIIKALNKKYTNKSFQKDEAGKIVTNLLDWDTLKQDNIRMVKPATLEIFEKGGNQSYKIAGIEGAFDVVNIEAVNKVNKICSELIVEVTKNTKKAISALVKIGIEEGKSMARIAREMRHLVGLTERQALAVVHYQEKLLLKYPKYSAAKLDRMAKKYSNRLHKYRTEMIARTETARAQNEGTLQGYKRMGYKKVRWSANVNACSRCMALSGHTFTLEEASGMMPLHPDCRCAWIVAREGIKPKKPSVPRRGHLEGNIPKDKAIAQFIEDAKTKGKVFKYEEAEEIFNSVKAYSGGLYKDIRSYQMNPSRFINLNKPQVVKDVKKITKNLDKFFKYSAKYKEKMIYRGIDLTEKEIALFKKGQIIDLGGASSFSSDSLTAARFGNVQFRLKNKTGISIKHISFSPSENEIIVSKGIKFKITNINKISKEIYDINIEEIVPKIL